VPRALEPRKNCPGRRNADFSLLQPLNTPTPTVTNTPTPTVTNTPTPTPTGTNTQHQPSATRQRDAHRGATNTQLRLHRGNTVDGDDNGRAPVVVSYHSTVWTGSKLMSGEDSRLAFSMLIRRSIRSCERLMECTTTASAPQSAINIRQSGLAPR